MRIARYHDFGLYCHGVLVGELTGTFSASLGFSIANQTAFGLPIWRVGRCWLDDELMESSEVLVRQVRKRRSAAEKRLIVEQALEPGASVARVARAHGLNANVVFHWRRLYGEGKLAAEPAQAMKLLPVTIAECEVVERPLEEVVAASCGSIHIELPGEIRISVEGHADPATIRAVLEVLRG